ncbi:hypothetical protein [Moraxella osloensis]|uniref:hypothetical protein n=1 Tax=Faucicola osloensis TaxID=34062 RepID=UPI002002E8FA|nr:hypothetical protein [Moraxella osloensis]MCK6052524.1 hypothetical protein [Moraxella osloensis]
MPHNYLATQIAHNVLLAVASSVASGVSIAIQLSTQHSYLGLQIEYKYFLIASIVLCFAGALLSLRVDFVKKLDSSQWSKVATAMLAGLVITFLILPLAVSTPSVLFLMITAFFGSLAGTILLHLTFELMGDKELLDAVKEAIKQFLISRFKRIAAFFGGAK